MCAKNLFYAGFPQSGDGQRHLAHALDAAGQRVARAHRAHAFGRAGVNHDSISEFFNYVRKQS